jgi:hypothetical protein
LEVHPNGQATYLRRRVNVLYDDAIRLTGYRWRTAGADLEMTVLWEASKGPGVDCKVFVHLLNVDGDVIRQYDAMPCNWECPTRSWRAGDTILDQALIPLWNLTAGEYRLAVGLYDAATQARLPAVGPRGERYPDAYFVLPDAFLISDGRPSQ